MAAAATGQARLAVNGLFGAIAANTAIFALTDLCMGAGALTFFTAIQGCPHRHSSRPVHELPPSLRGRSTAPWLPEVGAAAPSKRGASAGAPPRRVPAKTAP